MHTVVHAFDDADLSVEEEIFNGHDIKLIPSHGLESPASREIIRDADVLMVTLQKVTAEVLDAMPHCKFISRLGVGLDSIDLAAATKRKIWVANVPDYGVDEVSLHAISLMLSQLRSIPRLVANTQQGVWDSSVMRPIHRFSGQTLGILGFGRIGRSLAQKASGFGLKILAYDPYLDAAAIQAAGAQSADLDTILSESDFISLHLPLTDETQHLINAKTLATMKPTAYIVNTARGGLIDETALLVAVQGGRLRGAALDVLSAEPPPKDNAILQALLKEERILVTPHVAWYSEEAMIDMHRRGSEDVVRVLRGEKPRTPVNTIE
jgi:D-3-phosphoglycerate dehydrogenase / 2-oxoglutarate reductase